MLRRATIGLKWVALSALIVGAFTYAVAGGSGGCGVCKTTFDDVKHDTSGCTPDCLGGNCLVYRAFVDTCSGKGDMCRGTQKKPLPVAVYRTGCFPTWGSGCRCQQGGERVPIYTFMDLDICKPC